MIIKDHFQGISTPFLGLRARLTQTWIAPGILVLILFIVKLQLLKNSIILGLNLSESGAINACEIYEQYANELLQAPRTSAMMMNSIIKHSIQSALDGIAAMLNTMITGIEQLLIFAIELTVGTWACLTVSLFHAVATGALDIADDVITFVNGTIDTVLDDVNKGLSELTTIVNGATGLIGDIETFVTGSKSDIKSVNLTLSGLRNISIPNSVITKINSYKDNIPTYDTAKTDVEEAITIPFALIKSQLTNSTVFQTKSFTNYLSVPPKQNVSVCDAQKIQHAFYHCERVVSDSVSILCGVIAFLIVLVVAYYIYSTRTHWIRLENAALNLNTLHEKSAMIPATANMSTIIAANRSGLETRLIQWITAGGTKHVLLIWYIQYIFSMNALAILLLGIAGLTITLFEFIIIKLLSNAGQLTKDIVKDVGSNITTIAQLDLETWRVSVNNAILTKQDDLNGEVLGWVSTGTQAANNTLNKFMNEVNQVLLSSLGNTTLKDAVSDVMQCTIGKKVAMVEKGLTWIHDKSHVTFPLLPSNLTSEVPLSNASTTAKQLAMNGVESLVQSLERELVMQAWVSAAFVIVWGVFAIGGLVYVLKMSRNRQMTQKAPNNPFVSNEDHEDWDGGSPFLATGHRYR